MLASTSMTRSTCLAALALAVPLSAGEHAPSSRIAPPAPQKLAATQHAPLPDQASGYWLVPSDTSAVAKSAKRYLPLSEAVAKINADEPAAALAMVTRPALTTGPLADYAAYYKGVAELALERPADARTTFDALAARNPIGQLAVATAIGQGDAAMALGAHAQAVAIFEKLASEKTVVTDQVLTRLAAAARAAGDRRKAADALQRIYYEFALTDAAVAAAADLEPLRDVVTRQGYRRDLGRAAQLYGARRYADARAAFAAIQRETSGDDRELVDLRIAESDFFLQRYQAAFDGVQPWTGRGARQAEARFFASSALRELNRDAEYLAQTAGLVRDFADSTWSEEALNNRATFHILENEDALAAETFRELYKTFPTGQRAERAAWRSGWWSYKNGDYADTVRVFESAATAFPRSDYRPSFLYWAGRSHAKLGAGEAAQSRLTLVETDYGRSYYGRLATRLLPRQARSTAADAIPAAASTPPSTETPPTLERIRLLLASELYDDAISELRFVQRTSGTSPAIEATIAWAYHRKGELRRAITLMRRAYPQHLTGDRALPAEILQVIFPLTYWDLIQKHSAAHGLDPYMIAALVAQESTFDPKVRSVANAWGLMQILPATGRRLATAVGIRRFTTTMLTDPAINVRLGTLYFARLVKQFGGSHFALASYNAGENRVVRWRAERPGVEEDEFIDDIPFPETQNYVKRILGTAEDYRRLYTKGGGRSIPHK